MLLVLDPGLATCGAALFDDADELVDADVFTSSPGTKPKGARGAWFAADLGRRCHELATWVRDLADRLGDPFGDDTAVLESFGAGGRAGSAVIQMAAAAGTIRCGLSEALPPGAIEYVTPEEWRTFLGWRPSPRPRKAPRAELNAIKRDDDARLYAMIRELRGADDLERLVLAHGRRRGDLVHAWDALGIGRCVLARRALNASPAALDAA